MAIGTDDKWKIYVVRKSNDPPTTSANFTDYSDYVISWITKGAINQLSYFEATFVSIDTADEKLDITKGNLIYLMVGTKLVGKFVIGKPDYRTDFTVKISGYQSSGTEMINRKLANESVPKRTYDNRAACYILNSTCNICQGILVDGAENTILCLNPSCYGTSCPYSVKYDYENRIAAVDKLIHKTGQEWWVDHGTNDATPYSEGDFLNVADQQGNSTSTKTFYFTGTNQNAIISEGAEEIETNASQIIMQGQDQRNIQTESNIYDAVGQYTCITNGKAIDGWLSSNITANGTVIPLTDGSMGGTCVQITGTGYWGAFRIDDEIIKSMCITGSPPILTCVTRGFYGTEATPHSKGADIMLWQLGTSTCTSWSNLKLCVDCPNCLRHTSCSRLGTEVVCVKNLCNIGGYVCIERLNWDEMYSHGESIWIKESTWDESNPDNRLYISSSGGTLCVGSTITGCTSGSTAVITALSLPNYIDMCSISGNFCCNENICQCAPVGGSAYTCREYCVNSIQQNGLYSKTFSDNTARNKNMLDKAAQRILLTKKSPIKRIVIDIAEPMDMWPDINIGDVVTLGDGSEIGLSDGVEVRITGFEFSFDGAEQLLLYCNDKETRTYPSTDVSYVQEKEQTDQAKQQEAIRTYGKQDTISGSCSSPSYWSESLKRLTNVLSPSDDFDAVNKKYVDASSSKWVDGTNPFIIPSGSCSVCAPIVCATQFIATAGDVYMTDAQISGDAYVTGTVSAACFSGGNLGYGCVNLACCVCTGGGVWQDVSPTYMKPCESRSIYPKFANVCNLGKTDCRWNYGYFNTRLSSTTCIYTGGTASAGVSVVTPYVCATCVWGATCVSSSKICGLTSVVTPYLCSSCVWADTRICTGGYICATNFIRAGTDLLSVDMTLTGNASVIGTVAAACFSGGNLGYGCVNKACIACNGLWDDIANPYICPSNLCSLCGPTLIFNNVIGDYVDASYDITALGGDVCAGDDVIADDDMRICGGGSCGKLCMRGKDGSMHCFYLCSTNKYATIEYEPYKLAILKVEESPEVWFNDRGTANLCNGCARICIDCIFNKITEEPYHIQVTPLGKISKYWIEKGDGFFDIKTENTDNIGFDWQLSAIRKGMKNLRWKSENKNIYLDGMNTFESYNKSKWR